MPIPQVSGLSRQAEAQRRCQVPEGHTIHRLAREHKRLLGGRPVAATSPQGRFSQGAALIDGQVLTRTDAYGKHLFHRYGGLWLHVHLGLFGKFFTGELPAPVTPAPPRLRLVGDGVWVDLRGATTCQVIVPAEKRALQARLGPDPLRRGAEEGAGWRRLSRSGVPVGQLLMDQQTVAGVGNVYRAEVLFRARLDPYRPGGDVDRETWLGIWSDLVALMRTGVRTGRIVTTLPEHRSRRSGPARPEDAHYVYRRVELPCRVCGGEVRTAEMAGRNLYWCPACQR
jgi:endonuclease-8